MRGIKAHGARARNAVEGARQFLPQATDGERFGDAHRVDDAAADLLFVGNTRNQRRLGVEWAIEVGLPLTVIGDGWMGRIPSEYVRSDFVPNHLVPGLYASAKVVLADHWPDMRDRGFVSNRIFDALAAGAVVVSDPVIGMEDLFGDVVQTYDSAAELSTVVNGLLDDPPRRAELAEEESAWCWNTTPSSSGRAA